MKQYSTPKKALAAALSALFCLIFLASAFFIVETVNAGCYQERRNVCIENAYARSIYRQLDHVQSYSDYESYADIAESYANTNFEFDVYDGETLMFSSRTIKRIIASETYRIFYDHESNLYLTGYAVESIAGEIDLFHSEIAFVNFLYSMRYIFLASLIVSAVLFLPLFLYLLLVAGKRPGEEKARGSFIEKIPFDLFTLLYVGLFLLVCWGFMLIANDLYSFFDRITYIFATLLGVASYLLVLLYIVSFITRIRIGGILKTTLVWRILSFIFRMIGKFFRFIGRKIRAVINVMPIVWQAVLATVVLFSVDIIALIFTLVIKEIPLYFFYFIIRNVFIAMFVGYVAVMLRKLQKGGEAIAGGDFSYQIETDNMIGDFRKFGNNLNSIGVSMEKAVDDRLKSERMKTELITNVSHDIKTPLTSIINYVDLIKKENPESETIREYVDVLDRQSNKLKKLIGDLVEASKASTGNIAINMEECDVTVLLEQTVGEYEEKLQKAGLSAVVNCCKTPMKIMADGRYLWRIFDNLMNNICKYSLPGTRVYLETRTEGDMGIITFKNISQAPIDIPADELTERFVRADTSRNTEGSGLGLSIAESLAKLQNGSLDIVCDGDLFKAILMFKTI